MRRQTASIPRGGRGLEARSATSSNHDPPAARDRHRVVLGVPHVKGREPPRGARERRATRSKCAAASTGSMARNGSHRVRTLDACDGNSRWRSSACTGRNNMRVRQSSLRHGDLRSPICITSSTRRRPPRRHHAADETTARPRRHPTKAAAAKNRRPGAPEAASQPRPADHPREVDPAAWQTRRTKTETTPMGSKCSRPRQGRRQDPPVRQRPKQVFRIGREAPRWRRTPTPARENISGPNRCCVPFLSGSGKGSP